VTRKLSVSCAFFVRSLTSERAAIEDPEVRNWWHYQGSRKEIIEMKAMIERLEATK
jgi:hypothetical protein